MINRDLNLLEFIMTRHRLLSAKSFEFDRDMQYLFSLAAKR